MLRRRLSFACLALLVGLVATSDAGPLGRRGRRIPPHGAARGPAPIADLAPPAGHPKVYVAFRAATPPAIDGRLDDPAWRAVPWTDEFVDIEGDAKPRPRFRTRAKMCWDERCLYVAAQLDEPHVWGTLVRHDSVIFHDNDFEVFVDPDGDNHRYGEFEINALNTGWDLFLPIPYKDGGKADDGWEIPGLRTAVHVDGTLDDPRDVDRGWSVELAFPWEVLVKLQDDPPGRVPLDGDQWRINFSRVEWLHEVVDGKYRKVPERREDNWVWSPQGVIDMHRPEHWGYLQFSTCAAGSPAAATVRPRLDPTHVARETLQRVYYAQQTFRKTVGRFASTLAELGVEPPRDASLLGPPTLEATADGFVARIDVRLPDGSRRRGEIRQDSRLRFVPLPP